MWRNIQAISFPLSPNMLNFNYNFTFSTWWITRLLREGKEKTEQYKFKFVIHIDIAGTANKMAHCFNSTAAYKSQGIK